jgi:hypothetical protein
MCTYLKLFWFYCFISYSHNHHLYLLWQEILWHVLEGYENHCAARFPRLLIKVYKCYTCNTSLQWKLIVKHLQGEACTSHVGYKIHVSMASSVVNNLSLQERCWEDCWEAFVNPILVMTSSSMDVSSLVSHVCNKMSLNSKFGILPVWMMSFYMLRVIYMICRWHVITALDEFNKSAIVILSLTT